MTEIPAGNLKKIAVNRSAILEGRLREVFIIRQPGERTIFCGHVEILERSELVRRDSEAGARQVFLETEGAIRYE